MTSEPNGSGAPTTERRTYSVAEASTILGCSKAHLYGMIERETFKVITATGGTLWTLEKDDAPSIEKARNDALELADRVGTKLGLKKVAA